LCLRNEVGYDVDGSHVCAESSCWQRGVAGAACDIENGFTRVETEASDELAGTPGVPFGNATEVA
jgi:hypothetical protein